MENILFVLGADDPEMREIESILESLKYNYTFASVADKRCNPSNSYKAEYFNFFYDDIVYIECDTIDKIKGSEIILIDHHHKGDFGHSLGSDKFLEASSIGQFIKFLFDIDFDYVLSNFKYNFITNNRDIPDGYFFEDNDWKLASSGFIVTIPHRIYFIAGIDHCSTAAYNGECKGIDQEGLLEIRVEAIADNLNIGLYSLLNVLHKYTAVVEKLIEKNGDNNCIIDLTHIDLGLGVYSADYLILRELAISNNIPIAVKVTVDDKDIYKLMFLSLEEDQVSEILNSKTYKTCELYDVFGVPARGYAGGFVKREFVNP